MASACDEPRLVLGDTLIFVGLSAAVTATYVDDGAGAFLELEAPESQSRLTADLGLMPELGRFTVLHRTEPYWMKPRIGTEVAQIPAETQFLLGQCVDGRFVLVVPLLDAPFRFSLRGRSNHHLELLAETGDSFTAGRGGLALYVAIGEDPFELCRRGALAVNERLGLGKLRLEKPVPEFIETFGWCTWDAFYSDVSVEKLRTGLESFRAGGVSPKFVILDDGWQSTSRRDTGETRLTSFAANEKFPGGLGPSVRVAKDEFGVTCFLVWHAMQGYWGGVDDETMPGFGVVNQTRQFGEGILTHEPTCNQTWWGNVVGLVGKDHIERFYDTYHRGLAQQGVDGVKVDSQAVLEGVSQKLGGRVEVTLAYRQGLEKSAKRHFAGTLINCMSHAQETWYASKDSTLIRSSIDFFPNFPSSHGEHLYTNAMMGIWFGHFMTLDWDMFQSAHQFGEYHAAARAISGGPVYCSDKPDGHDFERLSKLVCSDGTVLRYENPAYVTRDGLMRNPTQEDGLLKIANSTERYGVRTGVVGVFFARSGKPSGSKLSTVVRASDVEGLSGERFACFTHRDRGLCVVSAREGICITLSEVQFELVTFVPIESDFAAIGLADKYSSALSILSMDATSDRKRALQLRDGGVFVAYCGALPTRVTAQGIDQPHSYEPATGRLTVELPRGAKVNLEVEW